MPMRYLGKTLIIASVVARGLLSPGAALACAQDQQSEDTSKPKPAGRGYPSVGYPDQDPSGDQESSPPLQPDTRPLTGVQIPTLGLPELRHSYWVPGFQYSNMIRSTALNQANAAGWNSTSYITGNVSLLQAWSNSQLSVNYSGGGFSSTESSQGNGYFHQFALVQIFKWQRWQLTLLEQFSYLPETSFGFGGGTGISLPGVGGSLGPPLPGLGGNFQPNQTVFTSFGTRYSNSFTTQAVYELSPRGSINVAGSYGILRFLRAGNIESNDYISNVGYNYALGKKDTLGVLYRFSAYRYIGNPQAFGDHVVQLSYGRKITGRLALQISGGPEITTFHAPIGNATNHIGESANATLNYATARNNLTLAYIRGVSNGSGIQLGSNADQIQAGVGRRLSREWQGNVNFGYARNKSLGNLLGASQNSQTYNSYYMSGGLSRPLGRDANFSLAYAAEIQTSNQTVCASGTCNTSYTQHQITLGFSWHARPFVLR
jgi:hypothetical protein